MKVKMLCLHLSTNVNANRPSIRLHDSFKVFLRYTNLDKDMLNIRNF